MYIFEHSFFINLISHHLINVYIYTKSGYRVTKPLTLWTFSSLLVCQIVPRIFLISLNSIHLLALMYELLESLRDTIMKTIKVSINLAALRKCQYQ